MFRFIVFAVFLVRTLLVGAASEVAQDVKSYRIDEVHIKYTLSPPDLSESGVIKYEFSSDNTSVIPLMRGATFRFVVKSVTDKGVARRKVKGVLRIVSPFVTPVGSGWFSVSFVRGRAFSSFSIVFPGTGIGGVLSVSLLSNFSGTLMGIIYQEVVRPAGMRLIPSTMSQPESLAVLKRQISSNPDGPRLIANVDHTKAAKSVGLKLAASNLIVFGRPEVGFPLWSLRALIGIELPLEMLIVESPLGVVYVGYNTASLYRKRYNLFARDELLTMIDNVLAQFASIATGTDVKPVGLTFDADEKILGPFTGIYKEYSPDVDAALAWATLLEALEAAPPVKVAFAIEHDMTAIFAGLDPGGKENKVVAFGNPALGTPLMQTSFTAAIDLPVKIGVWTFKREAKNIYAGYTTPEWIAGRHFIDKIRPELRVGLTNFVRIALGKE